MSERVPISLSRLACKVAVVVPLLLCYSAAQAAQLPLAHSSRRGIESTAQTVNGRPVTTECSDAQRWSERFEYANALALKRNFKEEKRVLEAALSDRCHKTRQHSLELLQQALASEDAESAADKTWKLLQPDVMALVHLAFWIGAALVLLGIAWPIGRFFNRRSVLVQPLTVSPTSLVDGSQFITIAVAMNQSLQVAMSGPEALPASSAVAPRMITGYMGIADDVVQVLGDDQAGKILKTVFAVLRRPRFVCSGVVHIAGRASHIVVRIQSGRRTLQVWEKTSLSARLWDDLKDLSYAMLRFIEAELLGNRF